MTDDAGTKSLLEAPDGVFRNLIRPAEIRAAATLVFSGTLPTSFEGGVYHVRSRGLHTSCQRPFVSH